MNFLTTLFGSNIKKWCTIIFTRCNNQEMTKEKYKELNKQDSEIIAMINSVQNTLFGDNMIDENPQMEAILINRRKNFLQQIQGDINSSNDDYFIPKPENIVDWILDIIRFFISPSLTLAQEITKLSKALIADITTLNKFESYYGECSICKESIWQSNKAFTKCNHIFHDNCLTEWLKRANTCPICRESLIT